jgi:CDP-diacylglycerol--glycerol-3-phosphate 3-phosphatidyltransferase
MKHKILTIPNFITLLRIFLSLFLFAFKPFHAVFYCIAAVCGITDVLDGYIARHTHAVTALGSLLDSIADLVFSFVILIIIFLNIKIGMYIIYWIIGIVAIKFVSIIIGLIKYKKIAAIHTYANKAAGLIMFAAIFLLNETDTNVIVIIVCSAATIAAGEEMLINMISKKLDLDVKIIFRLKGNSL